MARPPRRPEEIAAVKDAILQRAVKLINDQGFEKFSMRKLGDGLGIAAKTIYNYYHNKDELYLAVLAQGFQNLYDQCRSARRTSRNPLARLTAMGRAYLEFGLSRAGYYNLMFTWQVPKYEDYNGTPLEPLARIELTISLELYALFITAMRDVRPDLSDDEVHFYVIYYWSLIHGYISGCNNTLLNYMHPDPLSLQGRMIDTLAESICRELESFSK